MANYTVIHKDHYGITINTVRPENLRFVQNLNAPHDISYELSLDRPMMSESNTAEGDPVGAYQHDWVLQRDGVTVPGMAGFITSLSLTESEESLLVTGKSWLHYLERRHYPFDPSFSVPQKPVPFQHFQHDMSRMIKGLLQAVLARDYSLVLDLSNLGVLVAGNWTRDTYLDNWEIDFGDTEDIQSKLSQLAEGKPPRCFDYSIDEHKVFRMYHPEYSDPETIQWILTVGQPLIPAKDDRVGSSSALIRQGTSWTDNGPMGTHIVGTGTTPVVGNATTNPEGDSAATRGIAMGNPDGEFTFRRLDFTQDFGSAASPKRIRTLTEGALRAGVRPQREVPMRVAIDQVPNFFTKFHVGNYFQAIVPMGAHTITGTKKIISVEVEVTDEGEETATIHNTLWRAWYNVDSSEVQL